MGDGQGEDEGGFLLVTLASSWYSHCFSNPLQKGIHVQSRGNEALPMELVKLLKTQDAGYIRTQIASDESVSYKQRSAFSRSTTNTTRPLSRKSPPSENSYTPSPT